MNTNTVLPIDRLLATLQIVQREGKHLHYSRQHLFSQPITTEWVEALEERPEIAERVEAFVSRYGRMQDTIGEKLFQRWLQIGPERLPPMLVY